MGEGGKVNVIRPQKEFCMNNVMFRLKALSLQIQLVFGEIWKMEKVDKSLAFERNNALKLLLYTFNYT